MHYRFRSMRCCFSSVRVPNPLRFSEGASSRLTTGASRNRCHDWFVHRCRCRCPEAVPSCMAVGAHDIIIADIVISVSIIARLHSDNRTFCIVIPTFGATQSRGRYAAAERAAARKTSALRTVASVRLGLVAPGFRRKREQHCGQCDRGYYSCRDLLDHVLHGLILLLLCFVTVLSSCSTCVPPGNEKRHC